MNIHIIPEKYLLISRESNAYVEYLPISRKPNAYIVRLPTHMQTCLSCQYKAY